RCRRAADRRTGYGTALSEPFREVEQQVGDRLRVALLGLPARRGVARTVFGPVAEGTRGSTSLQASTASASPAPFLMVPSAPRHRRRCLGHPPSDDRDRPRKPSAACAPPAAGRMPTPPPRGPFRSAPLAPAHPPQDPTRGPPDQEGECSLFGLTIGKRDGDHLHTPFPPAS